MKIKTVVFRFCSIFLKAAGTILLLLILLGLTDLPFNAYHWLGTSNSKLKQDPDVIVILGGSGMPSPDGFIRCFYGSEAANLFPDAEVIIALPTDESDSSGQLDMMAHELILHGVDSTRIKYESLGFNTHSQAENIAKMHGPGKSDKTIILITSPEHMYRSVRCFLKVGYKAVGGLPTFEKPIDEEKIKDKQKTKDKRVKNLTLRYNIWSYLHYEILVVKEFFAISYYKLKGWI
jgi:uncharacterized SAM-binding protein YcdF (DUF218 family)